MKGIHHSERGKKTRQTKEEVGRQHRGMDGPGARQVPEGSGEQRKMEKTGCKITCGVPPTLAVKGSMMIMMIVQKYYRNHRNVAKDSRKHVTESLSVWAVVVRTSKTSVC